MLLCTHSSVNLTRFLFLSHQGIRRNISVQAKSTFIYRHFELPQNKYIFKIKIISTLNNFQTMQDLHLWKKIQQNNIFCFNIYIKFEV